MFRECRLLDGGSATGGVATAALLRNAASLRRLSLLEWGGASGAAAVFDELFGVEHRAERLQPLAAVSASSGATPSAGSRTMAHQGLREFELNGRTLGAAGLAALGRGLRSRAGAALEKLTVHMGVDASVQRRDAIACKIADALSANGLAARLRVLTLSTSITDEGAGVARVCRSLLRPP